MVVDAVAVVEAVEVVKVSPAATKVSLGELPTSLIRVPNTQICQMVNGGGVECISDGAEELFLFCTRHMPMEGCLCHQEMRQ